jgi:hypothetical protein
VVPDAVVQDGLQLAEGFCDGSGIALTNLNGALLRGFAVTSHNNGTLGNAVFDTVTTTP